MKSENKSPFEKATIAIISLMAINFAAQPYLQHYLFDWSLDFMLQKHEHSLWMDLVKYFEWPGRTFVSKCLSVGLLFFGMPQESWYLVTCTMTSEVVDRLLKLYFGVFRPFYYRDGMTTCYEGFANPSGHN